MKSLARVRPRKLLRRLVVICSVLVATASVVASVEASGGSTGFSSPTAAVPTADGGFLVADRALCVVKRVSPSGVESTAAGTEGSCGTGGDGGAATSAKLADPTDAVPTVDGGFLISSFYPFDCRVRKVSASGTITTIAGTGSCNGDSGDGGPATSAGIGAAIAVVPYHAPGAAVDTPGSGFLIAGGCTVRKVDGAGKITTVAGNGSCAGSGALRSVSCAASLCAAGQDTGLVATSTNPGASSPTYAVNKADTSGRPLTGISCPSASFCVAVDDQARVIASNNANAAVPTWTATNVFGTSGLSSVSCFSASLCAAGDYGGHVAISTNPGTASPSWTATQVGSLNDVVYDVSCSSLSLCVAADQGGHVAISTDPTAASPTWTPKQLTPGSVGGVSCVSTSLCVAIAGSGVFVTSNPTAGTPTWTPNAAADPSHGLTHVSCASVSLCVAVDNAGNSVTSVNPTVANPTWTVRHINSADTFGLFSVSCASTSLCVAINGKDRLTSTTPGAANPTWAAADPFGPGPDGVPAVAEQLAFATAAVPTADGGFLLAELGALSGPDNGARIRKISPSGIITTVAGTGVPGYSGDGGPATAAQLYQPTAAVPTPDGGFLISEFGNCIVRKVSASGTITTVAGVAPTSGPNCGNSGSGGPATLAQLYQPTAAVPVPDGSFLIGSYAPAPGTPANDAALSRVTASGGLFSALGGVSPPPPPPPAATLSSPLSGGVYGKGQLVRAVFSCSDLGGPGLSSCVGTVANGAPIDTSSTGAHVFTVTATDTAGQHAAQSVIYAVRAMPPPTLMRGSQSHRRWREGKPRKHKPPVGTSFSFTLNEPAKVSFSFTQQVGGRKVKGKCVAPTHKNRHQPSCKRTMAKGTLSFAGHSGKNEVSFNGHIPHSKTLAPGNYALLITAANSAGSQPTPLKLSFTIVK